LYDILVSCQEQTTLVVRIALNMPHLIKIQDILPILVDYKDQRFFQTLLQNRCSLKSARKRVTAAALLICHLQSGKALSGKAVA
jgi:hypothetical protein